MIHRFYLSLHYLINNVRAYERHPLHLSYLLQGYFDGKKLYEYRKAIFKRDDVNMLYIYATNPICEVVGSFNISEVITDTPEKIWAATAKYSGISKDYFDSYFKNHSIAHAIHIKDVVQFKTPIDPKAVIPNFYAPQNFMYVNFDI